MTELLASAREIHKNGMNRAAHGLEKHGATTGKRAFSSAFPKPTGKLADRNVEAMRTVRQILSDPARREEVLDRVMNIYDSTGRGVRFKRNGEFRGFLEP